MKKYIFAVLAATSLSAQALSAGDVMLRIQDLNKEIDNASGHTKEDLIEELEALKADNPDAMEIISDTIAYQHHEYAVLPSFFNFSDNTITCNGHNGNITIVDAANELTASGDYLILRFERTSSVSEIPKTFLNQNMRERFAVYDNNGREVAFINGVDTGNTTRYKSGVVYEARYRVPNAGYISNIKCASRQFDRALAPNGEYETADVHYDSDYLRDNNWR